MPEEKTEQQPPEAESGDESESGEQDQEGTLEKPDASGSFVSPEAMIMLPLALLLDSIGLVLLIFGLDDFFVTDVVGITMIGGWTFFRSRQVQMTQGSQARIGKTAQKMKRLRPLLIFAEFIPYVGALPCWTILVFSELKK